MTCGPIVHVSHFYSILAQFIALALTLSGIGYFLHKKGLSVLRSLIQQSHDHVKGLEEEKKLLAEHQRDLDQSIKDQALLFEHLSKALSQWSLAQEKKIETMEARRQKLALVALENTKIRQAKIQEIYLAQRVVPEACEQARIFFKEKFSSQKQTDHFLSALCDRIEQNS